MLEVTRDLESNDAARSDIDASMAYYSLNREPGSHKRSVEVELTGDHCSQRQNNCTTTLEKDRIFYVSERVEKVDELVIVVLS